MWYKNIASRFFGLVTKHACDRQTDRQTDRITTPKTVLALLHRAVKTSTLQHRCFRSSQWHQFGKGLGSGSQWIHCNRSSEIMESMRIITGSIARSATRWYLSYPEADLRFFAPQGRRVAPMGVTFGTESFLPAK